MNVHDGALSFERLLSVPAPTTVRGQSTKLGASADGSVISYGSGRVAVLRSLSPAGSPSQFFTQHTSNVTVCKVISPYYAASGDAQGNLKVWDTTGNQSIKLEAKPISRITDLSCDGEGKRLVIVGEGKQAFGATFSLDTGSSIGEVAGHNKVVNAVACKPNRPLRAVTGSDDFSVVMLNGVPFKYASTQRRHTRFVQSVDYAPSGSLFASAGSDGLVNLYDGSTGDDKGSLIDQHSTNSNAAHSSGVYAVSFSRDSTQLATSGADAKVKLWDAATSQIVQTWDFAANSGTTTTPPLMSQQVGNVWAGSNIVSLSFSGDLNVIDPRSSTVAHVLHGHQNSVTAVTLDSKSQTFFSGDSTGRVLQTSVDGESSTKPVEGSHHSGLVVELVSTGNEILSTSFDDTLRKITTDQGFDSSSISTGSQPKGIAIVPNKSIVFLATSKDIQVIESGSIKFKLDQNISTPICIASTIDGHRLAVATEDLNLTIYDSTSTLNLKLITTIQLRNSINKICFSNDSNFLAVGLTNGKIPLYKFNSKATSGQDVLTLIHSRWTETTGKITSLSFEPIDDGDNNNKVQDQSLSNQGPLLVSGSLDESLRVYNVSKPSNVVSAKNTHKGGVASVVWHTNATDSKRLVSVGADGTIKSWTLKL
ncbi:WD40 repeat-like protein [Microbotryomycetes sp. JL221]|nr:WD40 repeat-like protein [Microbotryomycetes sp. JL221]